MRSRVQRLWFLAFVALVAPTLVAADCPLPYVAHFDDPASGWRRVDEPTGGCDYVDGEYAVWSNLAQWVQEEWAPVALSCTGSLAVETTVYSRKDVISVYYGILVGSDSDNAYWFCVAPQSLFRVSRTRNGTLQNLVPWTKCEGVRPSLSKNDISVIVSGTSATLRVNGTTLTAVDLESQTPSRAGVFVGGAADKDQVEARFTSFSVREATQEEIAAVQSPRPSTLAVHDLPFADNFDDPSSGWSSGSDEYASWQYTGGTYSVSLKEANRYQLAWAPLAGYCPANLAVEATEHIAPGARDADCGVVWGLGNDDFYRFRVSADGFYSIDHRLKGAWQAALVGWTESDQINQGSAENRLRVVVAGSEAMVEVNGNPLRVVQLSMPGPYKVGILGDTNNVAPAEVRFTSFAVREATREDIAALGTVKIASAGSHDLPFSETFDFPSSGWTTSKSESSDVGYRSGEYFVLQKKQTMVSWSWAPLTSTCPQNYVVEVKAYALAGKDAEYGIVWGLDGQNFYWFWVSADGKFGVALLQGGKWQTAPVQPQKSGSIKLGGLENHLRLIVVGQRVAVQINGETKALFGLNLEGQYLVAMAGGSEKSIPAELRFTEFAVRAARPEELPIASPTQPSPSPDRPHESRSD